MIHEGTIECTTNVGLSPFLSFFFALLVKCNITTSEKEVVC